MLVTPVLRRLRQKDALAYMANYSQPGLKEEPVSKQTIQ